MEDNTVVNTVVLDVFGEESITSVKVYPNPTSGMLNFDLNEEISVHIVNTLGVEVFNQTQINGSVSVEGLDSGLHIVHVTNNDGIVIASEKVMIK